MLKSPQAKGKTLENFVADRIVVHGLDPKARRDSGSGNGNREKGDIVTSMMILGRNVGIEVKNQTNIAIPQWWKQVEKLEKLGREPVLAFKLRGDALEATKVVLNLETLLRLVKKANSASLEPYRPEQPMTDNERKRKWVIEDLRRAAHVALKHLA